MDTPLIIPYVFPQIPGVGAAFTTRLGGASTGPYSGGNLSFDVGDDPEAVAENRRAVMLDLGVDDWAENAQVHGPDIVFEPEPVAPDAPGAVRADGLATSAPGVALAVKTADCQPVLLAHVSGKYVCGLHVGWRGNLLNLPGKGVAAFCARYGRDPAEVLAVRGPSLGPSESEFVNFDTEFGPEFTAYHRPETRTVDLWRLTRDQLAEAGLLEGNIFSVDLCTKSLPAFFSYRGEGTTGRQAGLIWIRKDE